MSGRPRSIDRDKILDAAEEIVAQHGAAGLTFDALAKAAGVTKSGVQYCYGTRGNLLRAMIARWGESFDAAIAAHQGDDDSIEGLIRAHIAAERDADEAENARSATMMTALLQSPEDMEISRAWYGSYFARLDLTTPEGLQLALAFLAAEGAFYLKSFRMLDLPPEDWDRVMGAIAALAETLPGTVTPPAAPAAQGPASQKNDRAAD
ncbi:TetR/AcrR family transcriptional regulator [Paracoccus aminophilus]|uniref:Transcriptional regulator, TetR family n=1 Tax=Paracoccus aminophilus JCM 7686 TaxID=1367847 RepID=S5XZT7_PARAH|nr:TetR/AcrR family transcriptional regulator [Paracoccus aminophilus]AGT10807.1 transcriptional regulator, TetR family [Paracoccus aminophilus JCM 7686]